jgi:hypothetical protein
MLKDDRMMGMLTFAVIMIAVGTLIQRLDFFERLFGTGTPAPELRADEAAARAGETVAIDVLANDVGLAEGDAARLAILERPRCGRAVVRDGRVQYRAEDRCAGAQSFRYTLTGTEGEASAEVRISVSRPEPRAEPARPAPAAAAGEADGGLPPPEAEAAQEARAAAPLAPPAADTPPQVTAAAPAEAPAEAPPITGVPAAAGGPSPPAESGSEPAPGGIAAAPAAAPDATPAGPPSQPQAPPPQPACTLPATLTLELGPAAMTEVFVDSPCHRGEVAELTYDGLRFAVALDGGGSGSIQAPGFRRSAEATLTLPGREPIGFTLPFRDTGRIDRVAVAWERPAGLDLHAFEFGARPGTGGHVSPERQRSFEAVRRDGGGWLSVYEPAGGRGQRIEVYSFWRRQDGPQGVVKLALGTVPPGPGGPDACAEAAGTDYTVLRASAGRLERPRLGRIGALDCTVLAGAADGYIGDAVDDLIVRRR